MCVCGCDTCEHVGYEKCEYILILEAYVCSLIVHYILDDMLCLYVIRYMYYVDYVLTG